VVVVGGGGGGGGGGGTHLIYVYPAHFPELLTRLSYCS